MDKRLSPSDAMFLYSESREQMLHVAALMPFTPAPDSPPDLLRGLMDELRGAPPVCSPWNLRLRTPELLWNPLHSWVEEPEVDLEYHVRSSALPSPGDERELGILMSRLHGYRVDLRRPPWEVRFIEGLERGQFAGTSRSLAGIAAPNPSRSLLSASTGAFALNRCRFCNGSLGAQLALREDVLDVPGDDGLVALEQLGHLPERSPGGLAIEADLDARFPSSLW